MFRDKNLGKTLGLGLFGEAFGRHSQVVKCYAICIHVLEGMTRTPTVGICHLY